MKKTIFLICLLATLLCMSSNAYAVHWNFKYNIVGFTYNNNNSTFLNGTNVTAEIYNFSATGAPTLVNVFNATSNVAGFFNLSIISDGTYGTLNDTMVKLVVKHNNSTYNGYGATGQSKIDYIGPSLPMFPVSELFVPVNGTMLVNFFMREAATLQFNITNGSSPYTSNVSFFYSLNDLSLGYAISEDFTTVHDTEASRLVLYAPAGRNYSMMVYPMYATNCMPTALGLAGLANATTTDSPVLSYDINVTAVPVWVTGEVAMATGGTADDLKFANLSIVPYLLEPGDTVFSHNAMPYNMSAWLGPMVNSEWHANPVTGAYNITLFASPNGTNYLFFAAGRNNSGEGVAKLSNSTYYGAFMNKTITGGSAPVTLNFALKELVGNVTNITLSASVGGTKVNITTKQRYFLLTNATGSNTPGNAFVRFKVNYSGFNNSADFTWLVPLSSTDSGLFSLPVLNSSVNKINVFTQGFAPRKLSFTQAQVWGDGTFNAPVNISMYSFNPSTGATQTFSGNVQVGMYKSTTECDVPDPATSCILAAMTNDESFNPFNVVIGGGSLSLRMRDTMSGIVVHYKNVDLLASGPPDAMFDTTASDEGSTGGAILNAWKFGSKGPEIYDEVLLGIPYNPDIVNEERAVTISLPVLYDDSWGGAWSSGAGVNNIPTDYIAYNTTQYQWLVNGTGAFCNFTDINLTNGAKSLCFINKSANMLWLKIPHFSGVGPQASFTAVPSTSSGSGTSSAGGSAGGLVSAVPFESAVDPVTGETVEVAKMSLVVGNVRSVPMETYDAETGSTSSEDHTIKVKEVGDSWVVVTVASTPIDYTLSVNIPKYIDLNGDFISDLKITLTGIKKGIAEISVQKIASGFASAKAGAPVGVSGTPYTPSTGAPAGETAPVTTTATPTVIPVWAYWAIGLVVVVAIGGFWAMERKKRKAA